jgi:hypothetical protein
MFLKQIKTWIQPLPDPDIKQKNPRGHGYQTRNDIHTAFLAFVYMLEGPGGSMSKVVGLPNNSYKPITNTRGFAPGFVNHKNGALDSQPQVIKYSGFFHR